MENVTTYINFITAIILLFVAIKSIVDKRRKVADKTHKEEHATLILIFDNLELFLMLCFFISIFFKVYLFSLIIVSTAGIMNFLSFRSKQSSITRQEIIIIAVYCMIIPIILSAYFMSETLSIIDKLIK
jgi:hypothetical protein